MKLSSKLEKVLNDQINLELCSAYAYLGMAAYFEHTAFTGFGKWMEVQSKEELDRKSTRLNSSHLGISYAVFCLKKKNNKQNDAGDGVDVVLASDDSIVVVYA